MNKNIDIVDIFDEEMNKKDKIQGLCMRNY